MSIGGLASYSSLQPIYCSPRLASALALALALNICIKCWNIVEQVIKQIFVHRSDYRMYENTNLNIFAERNRK